MCHTISGLNGEGRLTIVVGDREMTIFEIATVVMLVLGVITSVVDIWYRLKRVEMEKKKVKQNP